jgi:hypothetical protein
MCGALHATCTAAFEIARNTTLVLESSQVQESLALEQLALLVNRLVRLFTVALFNEDVRHAKTVLQNQRVGRWLELIVSNAHSHARQGIEAQTTF